MQAIILLAASVTGHGSTTACRVSISSSGFRIPTLTGSLCWAVIAIFRYAFRACGDTSSSIVYFLLSRVAATSTATMTAGMIDT